MDKATAETKGRRDLEEFQANLVQQVLPVSLALRVDPDPRDPRDSEDQL